MLAFAFPTSPNRTTCVLRSCTTTMMPICRAIWKQKRPWMLWPESSIALAWRRTSRIMLGLVTNANWTKLVTSHTVSIKHFLFNRWHTVTIDFAGPFVPSGDGNWDMVMVIVDKVTKRSHFIPCMQADTAPDVARRFFDGAVRLHGMPSVVISGRDPKFTSLFWFNLFERFGTRLAMSSANHHPQ